MTTHIKKIITDTVQLMIESSTSPVNIAKLEIKHKNKIHFIPIRYRIISGVLQGMNIKFGNFIESLVGKIVDIDPNVELMEDSGKRLLLYFTPETDSLIDEYITFRQLPSSVDDCTPEFNQLLKKIIEIETAATNDQRQGIIKDVDGLFKTPDGIIVYTEIKYNDDHDTGKFADINRKFIKTWAGLVVRLGITEINQLIPILYYFNPTKRYGPIHTPSCNIMRGSQLFDEYLQTKYENVDKYLRNIGDDPEILKLFDDFYKSVRNRKISKQISINI